MPAAVARPMPDPTAGQIGGIFAGIVALLVAVGHGIKWAIGWSDKRFDKRTAELEAWEAQLRSRERSFEDSINNRLSDVERENRVLARENRGLRVAFQHVSAALYRHDPKDPALMLAEQILAQSIPLDPAIPRDMQSKLDEMP